jgi:hypothetical protein
MARDGRAGLAAWQVDQLNDVPGDEIVDLGSADRPAKRALEHYQRSLGRSEVPELLNSACALGRRAASRVRGTAPHRHVEEWAASQACGHEGRAGDGRRRQRDSMPVHSAPQSKALRGVVCSVDDNKSLIPVSKSTVIAACRYDETATEQNGHGDQLRDAAE